jgi:hypothetical protein
MYYESTRFAKIFKRFCDMNNLDMSLSAPEHAFGRLNQMYFADRRENEILLQMDILSDEKIFRALQKQLNISDYMSLLKVCKNLQLLDDDHIRLVLQIYRNELMIIKLLSNYNILSKKRMRRLVRQQRLLDYYRPIEDMCVNGNTLSPDLLEKMLVLYKREVRIGNVLFQKGYISQTEIIHLLNKQKNKRQYVSFGMLCVEEGYIEQDILDDLLNNYFKNLKIGELLIKEGFLDEQKLTVALSFQNPSQQLLGSVCVELGYLTYNQLIDILIKYQKRLQIKDIIIRSNILTNAQVKIINMLQSTKKETRPFGEICIALGFLSRECLQRLVQEKQEQIRFGEILIADNILTSEQVVTVVERQQQEFSYLPFGEACVKMNYLKETELQGLLKKYQNDLIISNLNKLQ